ncbi:hypothetical protein J7U46_13800 [Pelomonas sp. V22]|uniref:hypothetical protein n=1 Tax=Pelomonas sp. V22 TaxID=2822139 RepID=UPI0024A82BD5|nr:hypothetical protein [Pelomonas sp. V22]MDI4634127.1 hypothetical protein [Pelomonas sp. V22]
MTTRNRSAFADRPMLARMSKPAQVLRLAVLLTLLGGCASQTPDRGQPLPGLRLDARPSGLWLEWTPDSLVNRALRPGTRLDVVAEYPSASGPVTGDAVGAVQLRNGQNAVQIELAPTLRRVPSGPVCLRLRVDGRAALPLRAGGGEGATDTFQHAAWARSAGAASQQAADKRERERAQQILGRLDTADGEHAAWMQQRGVNQAQQCELLSYVPAADGRPPRSVVEPAKQMETAQRDCSYRLVRLLSQEQLPTSAIELAAAMERDFQAESGPSAAGQLAAQRLRQAQQLAVLLRKFDAAITQADYRLALPLPASVSALALTSTADEEVKAAKASGTLRRLYEPLLDAFASCTQDTRAQLRLSQESWQKEQQLQPALLKQRNELLRAECRANFAEAGRRQELRSATQALIRKLEQPAAAPGNAPVNEPLSLLRSACR